MARKPKEAAPDLELPPEYVPPIATPFVDQMIDDVNRIADFDRLIREILTHTHATARLPAELLARMKAAVA